MIECDNEKKDIEGAFLYLYKKKYIARGTFYNKNVKMTKGISKFAKDMFKIIKDNNILQFQKLCKEYLRIINSKEITTCKKARGEDKNKLENKLERILKNKLKNKLNIKALEDISKDKLK